MHFLVLMVPLPLHIGNWAPWGSVGLCEAPWGSVGLRGAPWGSSLPSQGCSSRGGLAAGRSELSSITALCWPFVSDLHSKASGPFSRCSCLSVAAAEEEERGKFI